MGKLNPGVGGVRTTTRIFYDTGRPYRFTYCWLTFGSETYQKQWAVTKWGYRNSRQLATKELAKLRRQRRMSHGY